MNNIDGIDAAHYLSMMEKNKKLLIVDDNEVLRTILRRELEEMLFDVTVAVDGHEAIELMQGTSFALVLLDVNLPGIDGFQVLRSIKDNYPLTKVIMVTGYADMKHAIKARACGADEFVAKPYDLVELLASINRMITSPDEVLA